MDTEESMDASSKSNQGEKEISNKKQNEAESMDVDVQSKST